MPAPQASSPQPVPDATPAPGLARRLAAAAIVFAGFALVALAYGLALQAKNPTESDFIGYWAGARQLAGHANPYGKPACLALEKAAGYAGFEPRVTPSPPIALFLLAPFGLLGAKAGLFAWTMTLLALLAFSLRRLGVALGQPRSLAPLAGFVFAPALTCVQAGQLGILFLVSITLFLGWVRRRPLLAGAALLPLALKPHLFLPFALALLGWIALRRAGRVLAGACAAALAGAAVTFALDPGVWQHYLAFVHASALEGRYTPTLSVGLPLLFHVHAEALRFLPTALACAWAVLYLRAHHARWRWEREGLVVLAVSLACSPYAWFTDETVLLPAVLAAFLSARRAAWAVAAVAALPLVELALGADIKSWTFVWTPLAWLACALIAAHTQNGREQMPTAA